MKPRDQGICPDRNVGWCTFGISASTPTAVFAADRTVLRWFPELVWTFLRGEKCVPCPGLVLNNSNSASHLIENECNLGRQWHEGLEIHLLPRSIPRIGTNLDLGRCYL
jgi:hypothetical protein